MQGYHKNSNLPACFTINPFPIEKMSDTKLTLSYFPIGGRAEAIRLTAAIGGIAFTNNSIAFPDFMAAKNANPSSESMPFGQLPVLQMEKDGESSYITQSDAILRYFGKLAGMYPTDELEALKVDEFTSILQDLITPLAMTVRGAVKTHIGETDWTQEEKIDIRKRWLSADMPKYLSKLEESLKSSTSGWLVGDSVTIADVRIFVDLNWISGGILDGIPTNALENYPRCLALMDKVKSIEKVKEWKEKHPTPYQTFDFKP
jgi:glutathione S-transferase